MKTLEEFQNEHREDVVDDRVDTSSPMQTTGFLVGTPDESEFLDDDGNLAERNDYTAVYDDRAEADKARDDHAENNPDDDKLTIFTIETSTAINAADTQTGGDVLDEAYRQVGG